MLLWAAAISMYCCQSVKTPKPHHHQNHHDLPQVMARVQGTLLVRDWVPVKGWDWVMMESGDKQRGKH